MGLDFRCEWYPIIDLTQSWLTTVNRELEKHKASTSRYQLKMDEKVNDVIKSKRPFNPISEAVSTTHQHRVS